ncbi:MAG: hypothetical protein CMG60_01200 [Candidatus Marinimicrobia bacterium]|nr:hypothetical protein [Candidatus Neomarinimicrobiota bacterium]
MKNLLTTCLFVSLLKSQVQYNHPELNWHTFETDHFMVHFHEETEGTARESATVAEFIYPFVTSFYDFEPSSKTHLVLLDPDDYSNGAAYYYDNKILIWASPLDFELRGSHRWLQNVITHEFVHIVSLQKSMKAGMRIPGAYLQLMDYENEKRPDVLYGYPNTLISYPIPFTVVPPWLAEGIAQYMYDDADWDNWDSHRDMILRDRVINNNMLSFNEMNTFGKKGIGNESTYNAGYALSTYIANEFGSSALSDIMEELSSPFQFSISRAIENVLGLTGEKIYSDFKNALEAKYKRLIEPIKIITVKGDLIHHGERSDNAGGTTNLYPKWHPKDNLFIYLSNKNNDFFGQTDLYLYDFDTGIDKKLKSGVFSAPAWHPDGKIIFYSKKSKFPNKNGSRFYDIYSYNIEDEKEERITFDARAFNPIFIEKENSVIYLATNDGGQNIHIFNLDMNKSSQLTNFTDRSMISFVNYDEIENKLYFDITKNHFRDIYFYNLETKSMGPIFGNSSFDERNMAVGKSGLKIYASDKSGIFNLYLTNSLDSTEGYVTNVTGGAFMPDISKDGKILYSLYEKGCYSIALLDTAMFIEDDFVGYDASYNQNTKYSEAIIGLNDLESYSYEDQFPEMFIMPKLMLDYGTLKPGFYFASNEVIDRLSLFGGASLNMQKDVDLFFTFQFKRFYPTIYFETFYLTRNTEDESLYQGAYPIEDNIKFRLVQFSSGLEIPIYGTLFDISVTRQWYRAFIQEKVSTIDYGPLEAGAAYDYFRGWSLNGSWSLDMRKRTLDRSINPSKGFTIKTNFGLEKNYFIEGLNLSESGTLTEQFQPNDLIRIELEGSYHYEIPWKKRWTVSLSSKMGWITNPDVDSFFHFYLGGLPGLKGYPFYSIQGTKSGLFDLTFRVPLFTEKHYKYKWLILQNSTLGAVFQAGDAWINDAKLKRSIGIQWRLNGFSFYNYPTAIELEYHQPLNKFERVINDENISYGERGRAYAKILFDF